MDTPSGKRSNLLNYLFTTLIVVALVVIYLLTGQRQTAPAGGEDATAPSPSSTSFGRPAYAFVEDLSLYGVTAVETDGGYLLTLAGSDGAASAAGTLTLSLSNGLVAGFVLSFPAVEQPDVDGSAISAALQSRAQEEAVRQAEAMETILGAVLSAFDAEGALPATVRARWCAQFLLLQSGDGGKEDAHDGFQFETYPTGTGNRMRLCCAVLAP